MSFDPQSLAEIVHLQGFGALLDPEIANGLAQAGSLLVTTTQTNTWTMFANPTGRLAGSIYFYVVSPSEVAVAVGVPYGQRRERGFSGMTDALGRYYPYDPAKPYLEPAIEEDQDMVVMFMERAVNNALGRVAV